MKEAGKRPLESDDPRKIVADIVAEVESLRETQQKVHVRIVRLSRDCNSSIDLADSSRRGRISLRTTHWPDRSIQKSSLRRLGEKKPNMPDEL